MFNQKIRDMKTTEEGNKLIAEFMGEEIGHDKMVLRPFPEDAPNNAERWTMTKYHSSWDWLMPVVEKIGDENLLSLNIETVWSNVIEHIGWYNVQKQDGVGALET